MRSLARAAARSSLELRVVDAEVAERRRSFSTQQIAAGDEQDLPRGQAAEEEDRLVADRPAGV